MYKYLKEAFVGLFITLILLGGVSVYTIFQLQSNARLINYTGIIRGATQRLVKLELYHQESDDIITYLDGIMKELNEGKGQYALPLPNDEVYQQRLFNLTNLWEDVKHTIFAHRNNTIDNAILLEISETYFDQANALVFAAEEYTSEKLHSLIYLCVSMLAIMAIIWMYFFMNASKKLWGLEKANKHLSDIVKRDTLTGVYVIHDFKEKAQALLSLNPEIHYALIYTDFADFKYINDVFGYTYGDNILQYYGNILNKSLHEGELCGRVSADHFVILRTYTKRDEIITRQKDVDEQILQYMQNAYDHHVISTCCGICCIEDVDKALFIDGYLDRANLARSTVKSGVNANYMFYNETIRKQLIDEKTMETHMHEAFLNKAFFVEYQPKVNVRSGKIANAEALVRWRLNKDTIVYPDRFIPVLERKFMITQLDQFVMEQVCSWLRQMLDKGNNVLPVGVNVSRLQFYDQNFVQNYIKIREKYRIPKGLIEIEFTESIVFENVQLLKNIISELKQNGFLVAIDDFGKGYSALSLLKDLHVDCLKIDRYFFEEGQDARRDFTLIQGIMNMVHNLHIKTVAEGIESQQQVEMLRNVGCDYIQGYVYYRPMSKEDYAILLQDEKVANQRKFVE